MALQKTLTMADGLGGSQSLSNVYIKVISIEGNKSSVSANVGYFKTRDGLLLKTKLFEFSPDLDGGNFISQAYSHLKQTDEFVGSENV